MRRTGALLSLAALACFGASGRARAFTTRSGFSSACHERMTVSSFLLSQGQLPGIGRELVPEEDDWSTLLSYLAPEAEQLDEEDRFLLYSLLVGARAPDTEGYSLTNVAIARAIQSDPAGQYAHCLRAPEDDRAEGDATALAGCRAVIADEVALGLRLAAIDPNGTTRVRITIDDYGTLETDVNGAAYHIGRALHTVQDGFSHTLRDPAMRDVVHVMNYIDAVTRSLDEERDGLAHSSAADDCVIVGPVGDGSLDRDRVFATVEASSDLLVTVNRILRREPSSWSDRTLLDEELESYFLRWFRLADPARLGDFSECTEANDYCDSPWLGTARLEPAAPLLSCAATPERGSPTPLGLLVLTLLATFGARRYSRWRR